MAIFGVDVSIYQKNMNYTAARIAGVRFAMVKATQGHSMQNGAYLFRDKAFIQHVNGFRKAGIPVGAYHFFTATNLTETYREADFFLETVIPYRDKIKLFLACDAENYKNKYLKGLNRQQLSALVNAFCERVESAGFKACHYTNTDHIANFIDLKKINYPVWQAHYAGDNGASRPTDAGDMLAIHQYTSTGQLPGIAGNFDLNHGYVPLARLIISAEASIMDVTLDYIQKYPTGEHILMALAEKLVVKPINPVKNPSHEKKVSAVCSYSGIQPDEAAYLNAYKWSVDLFHKLYFSMLVRKTV